MKASFVIDASIAMAWCFDDEATPATRRLLDRMSEEAAVVPGLWYLEVANLLALAERKRRISAAQVQEYVSLIESFDLEVDDQLSGRAFTHLLPLCRNQELTSYDAVYLELALRRRLPLCTLDNGLRAAARALGCRVLGR